MNTLNCVTIGTRGSALALWQAGAVRDALVNANPDLNVEIRVVKTTGDINLSTPMAEIGDKGLFTKELEVALLTGEVDMCVHSMKDMPSELPEGCTIAAMLPRADVHDVLVCGPRVEGATSLQSLPEGARIATGSVRRTAQLKARYPHIVPAPIRGNVDTRLEKAKGPHYEGAILAAAGVVRMGREDQISTYLSLEEMLPAVGQGAIGIEAREGDEATQVLCKTINHQPTFKCVQAERAVLRALEGGCQVPIGVYVHEEDATVHGEAVVFSLDGQECARAALQLQTQPGCHEQMAEELIAQLEREGALQILARIKEEQA